VLTTNGSMGMVVGIMLDMMECGWNLRGHRCHREVPVDSIWNEEVTFG
jgi:hypothetical protein